MKPLHFSVNTSSGKFHFNIDVVPVKTLRPHEETIENNFSNLKADFLRSNIQRDPIIVDEKSNVILDGMHRFKVSKEIGLRYIVVMQVDYSFDGIKIEGWNRVFSGDVKKAVEIISNHNFKMDGNDCELISRNVHYRFSIPVDDILQRCRIFDNLVGRLATLFGGPQLTDGIKMNEHFTLIPPVVKKEEVIDVASKGECFPPKSTRHIFPVRVLSTSVPLNLLMKEDSLVKEAVLSSLEKKGRRLLSNPKRGIAGAHGQEKLMLFL
jgi:hypothetical protein